MSFVVPTLSQFKTQFFRDFPYGTNPNANVLDADITNAFNLVNMNINPDLFSDQNSYTIGYNYLAAHYLVMSLRSSSQGINGQFNFLQAGKGVGAVNESFSIPQMILDNPYWSIFTKTNYGMQFLFLVLPQLIGQTFNVYGTTLA